MCNCPTPAEIDIFLNNNILFNNMSIALLIAINPPKEIADNIVKIRKFISQKTGKNTYGSHDPHITLSVNSFPNFSDVEKRVLSVLKKHKPFSAKIEGLHTFPFDPILKTNTVVYKVERTPTLAKIQEEIVNAVNPIRTEDQVKWLLKQNPHPPKENMKNIRKYGYPFGPKDWIFHASVGSVSNEHYEEIWKKIQKYNLSKTWRVDNVSIFVHLGDDGFKLFKKYKL